MCSKTRGPANVPSFVTCPTKNKTKLRRFASRINSCPAERTCPTVPGAESNVSVNIV